MFRQSGTHKRQLHQELKHAIIQSEVVALRDTILILKNQQATSTTAISWKSEHPRIDALNKFA